jgi:hypothetical protein
MDALALASALLLCAAITVASLVSAPHANPLTPAGAPWCLPNQTPAFAFGFSDLSTNLGAVMGQPVECEHGAVSEGDTLQTTTTGMARYQWCTNSSTFTRGSEHWTLRTTGVVHWTDGEPPPEAPIVRAPDLRVPCAPT